MICIVRGIAAMIVIAVIEDKDDDSTPDDPNLREFQSKQKQPKTVDDSDDTHIVIINGGDGSAGAHSREPILRLPVLLCIPSSQHPHSGRRCFVLICIFHI